MAEKEFKTLKDLKTHNHSGIVVGYINPDELKAEAVKWVKDRMLVARNVNATYQSQERARGMINDFMDFFNITEEDLKDG